MPSTDKTRSTQRPRQPFSAARLAAALALVTASSAASAAPSPADSAAAEAMFRDGKALAASGHAVEACEKFAESQRLDPATGTLLELAQCDEHAGRLASAWAEYTEAASAAQKAGRADRVKFAKGAAARVEPKMAHLTVQVPDDVKATPGLSVTRDGARVGPGAMGEAIPVDPGSHAITASAPGRVTWNQSVSVDNGTAPVVVAVPPLAETPAAAPPPVASEAPTSPAPGFWTARRSVGLAIAGAGVVGVVVGSYFGAEAASSWSSFKAQCNPSACANPSAKATYDDARSDGTLSTVFIIAGAVAVAGGATLFLLPTAKPAKAGASSASASITPYAAPGGVGVSFTGGF